MKRQILFILFISFSQLLFAQSGETSPDTTGKRMNTIFSNPGKIGWWVAPEFAWTSIGGRDAYLMGLSSGIIVNHSFSLGLAGYGILNSGSLKFSSINDTADVYLYGGYGGFRMEYRLMPFNVINVAFPLLIGGGGAFYSTWGSDDWQSSSMDASDESYVWDSYFVIEPGVMVGINFLKFMRLDTGFSYRFTSDIHLPRTKDDLMSNFNLNMSLKFGKF